ncbi:S-adenosyl-L-methionine-dependent methyltransferase [Lindgomyces ingoldianus]|uniref:S-adenosyl-L-methionine-dependent methyltransferase n=1 Tax=Lindgomyces ingoldianus TaxID=673940 RepID=A0ACB6QU00_9PLEO|nr:S-adenosyl-L-methionine-dependent methyltransferase [Lindgomyces ingoldianus]KAF2470458.1 S-adenosyl-L-methionine-dependent methyltransferase [Lindgomyces ingoldianus]
MSSTLPFRIRPITSRYRNNVFIQSRSAATSGAKKRDTAHWTPEKLRVNPKYPLAQDLYETTRPAYYVRTNTRGYAVHMRSQIVSPDLCDDVLKYIGPSLEKHKGCDILDLNPGAGLWSSKLHDFLQPRSHILLESQPDKYERFLRRLADKPDSTYKLVVGDAAQHDTIRNLVKEGIFPYQTLKTRDSALRQELNNSLLVTGTFIWDPTLPSFGFSSLGRQLIQHYAMHAWQADTFHAFGPVRSLFWLADEDLTSSLPRSMLHFSGTHFLLDRFTNARQVVTPGHLPRKQGRSTIGRDARYELESLVKAMKATKENGMELPAHRREEIHGFAEDIMRLTNGTGIMSSTETTNYLKEAELSGKSTQGLLFEGAREVYKVDKAQETNPELFWDREAMGGKNRLVVTKEGKKIARDRSSANQNEVYRVAREKAVDIGEDIYHLECNFLKATSKKAKASTREKLDQRNAEFKEALDAISKTIQPAVYMDLDDRLAIRSPVSRLMWDSRPYEPLVVQDDEVWPPHRFALVDFEPKMRPVGYDNEHTEPLIDFANALLRYHNEPLPDALEHLSHGGSELIDQVPALKDPARGGRLDMKHLRVRMLTPEMIDGLCRAWREWPFKPPGSDSPRYFQVSLGGRNKVLNG